jgi:hypothetical protein
MTAPTAALTITQRHKLLDLTWEKSDAVTPGRVMLCKGRRVVGFADVADLANPSAIAARCTTLVISRADFDDLKAWLS